MIKYRVYKEKGGYEDFADIPQDFEYVIVYDNIDIEAHNLELQEQAITTYKEQWKQDGQTYYDEMQNRIIAMLIGVENAVAIMKEIKQTINPMLEQIQRGNQSLAMLDFMDGENNPTIQEVIDLFNEIGQYCVTYYQEKYPH